MKFAGLHEGVGGRTADPERVCGFLRRQQEGLGGQHVAERLRISHVINGGGAV